MRNRTAVFAMLVAIAAGALSPSCAFAAERVDSTTWLSFYESLSVIKGSLSPAQVAVLNQDLDTIDAYYLGQYLDGINPENGDLAIKSDLSGLDIVGIHALATRYKAEMSQSNDQLQK